MDEIREYFRQMVDLDDADWQVFSSKLKKSEYRKKTILLKQGEVENHLSFIEEGSVRLYVPKTENDLTFGFCFKGEFISAYDSFLTRSPSSYQTETLTKTILWRLDFNDLQDIYKRTKIGNAIGRITAERLFLIKSRREQSLLDDTAEERYLKLFAERPQLIKEVPLKYLASYIGVTPQALSRIRKRIS
ncbi:Crp/Fnr family transcriptional regulator [Pseudozobellia thermophila]|uniref:cAMP-binding domain of CRP or a regulatory subunit of cAMP-dependent protein kinases n=1 Tax=Pseudozobellia thermophila TaxID=192903 RepID=A0A1M6ND28_9FLAO|nr:Crp/Fnr family transcriptional regulator [Pseudozobellia thermophila]SHJ93658.1 cAMP-binding domain of CRP or a regulatory subunit of cAMP-dependent protein kinases [Pseudozobellia thermophila]